MLCVCMCRHSSRERYAGEVGRRVRWWWQIVTATAVTEAQMLAVVCACLLHLRAHAATETAACSAQA